MKAWRQPSPYGELTVVVTAGGVHEISLPGDDQPEITLTKPDRAVARQLDDWFAGRRHAFDLTVDLGDIDGFRRKVLETLAREVPWGEVGHLRRAGGAWPAGPARPGPPGARCATTRSRS